MWSSLQELLPRAAGKYKIGKTLKAIEVCREYRRIAGKVLPEQALQNTYPKSYKNGALTIGANNSSWAQNLHMHKESLKKSLENSLGKGTVKKIKIHVGPPQI
jgi:predicted nucleic acid-binding Zn ribbon protein